VVVVRYREKVLIEGRRGRLLLLLLLSSISRANVWIENQIGSKVSFLFTRVWIEGERERERKKKLLWRVLMGTIVVVLILLFLLFFLAAAASGNR
jgi:dolichol kinase